MVRSLDDHGTGQDAIDFVLDDEVGQRNAESFLHCWRRGDLAKWPEFYAWLDQRRMEAGTEPEQTLSWIIPRDLLINPPADVTGAIIDQLGYAPGEGRALAIGHWWIGHRALLGELWNRGFR